jgi:hypothetical protein
MTLAFLASSAIRQVLAARRTERMPSGSPPSRGGFEVEQCAIAALEKVSVLGMYAQRPERKS